METGVQRTDVSFAYSVLSRLESRISDAAISDALSPILNSLVDRSSAFRLHTYYEVAVMELESLLGDVTVSDAEYGAILANSLCLIKQEKMAMDRLLEGQQDDR